MAPHRRFQTGQRRQIPQKTDAQHLGVADGLRREEQPLGRRLAQHLEVAPDAVGAAARCAPPA